jgi:hypothetical protein
MRKLIGVTVLAAIAISLPAVTHAQRRTSSASMGGAEHELGVDIGVAYTKPSNVSGGITIQTPFDVRFGFVPSRGNMMWEPRATLTFSSVGGTTRYLFTPDVNVLISNSPGGHRRGMYFTGGAGLVMGDVGAGTGTALELNGGLGWRKPYGSAAWRYQVGVTWVSSSTNLGAFADYIAIGGSIGISLWH